MEKFVGKHRRIMVRLLFAVTSILLVVIAILHGLGVESLGKKLSSLPPDFFIVGAFRAVWLGFSLTALLLALIFAGAALRPLSVQRWVIGILACIPIGSAILIYTYVGSFFGAHLLFLSGVFAVIGSMMNSNSNGE